MKTITLGSGAETITLTRLAMGVNKLQTLSDGEFFTLLDMYRDAGGNCIDTARSYGDGVCEEMVARYLKRIGRDRVVLVTKGCNPPADNMHQSRLSKAEMEFDLHASLRALQTDVIDLYFLHRDDVSIPVEEIMDSLNSLREAGKIRYFGCSNWHTERIAAANAYAKRAGLRGFMASQLQWSLAQSSEDIYQDVDIAIMDDASYAWYMNANMPVFAYASQAQGFFFKAMAGEPLSAKVLSRFASPVNYRRLANVMEYVRAHGVHPSVPVLGYITCNALPAVAIIGCKNPEHLRDTLLAAQAAFSPEEAAALARTFASGGPFF